MAVTADDIELRQTCFACPEQYDAFLNGEMVGYLRLRHGYFRVEVPDVRGELVYSADTRGDGAFDPEERDEHLNAAREAIAASLSHRGCICPCTRCLSGEHGMCNAPDAVEDSYSTAVGG